MKILVTAGPTREAIDPVRFISNHSSGKMGYALAEALRDAGHDVTLVSGPVNLTAPGGITVIPVISAAEMAEVVKSRFAEMDGAILCAAVADYRPVQAAELKIKKQEGSLTLVLERTEDILAALGKIKRTDQILVGFAAETDHLLENAADKIRRKNLDWIVANQVGVPGRGFQADNNAATLIARSGEMREFPLASKKELARQLVRVLFPGV